MRSPGVIYRQYRKLRKKHLFENIVEARRKDHKNCVWGRILTVTKNEETRNIPICIFDNTRSNGNYELCTCPKECNAFCVKSTKQSIIENFEDALKDPIRIKKEYPDLAMFQWILDKPLTDLKEYPPFGVRFIVAIISFLEGLIKFSYPNQKNLP